MRIYILLNIFYQPNLFRNPPQSKVNIVKKLQSNCLINSRIGVGLGDYGVMGDNQIPLGVLNGVWECLATMNHSWGYHHGDKTWKSKEHLFQPNKSGRFVNRAT